MKTVYNFRRDWMRMFLPYLLAKWRDDTALLCHREYLPVCNPLPYPKGPLEEIPAGVIVGAWATVPEEKVNRNALIRGEWLYDDTASPWASPAKLDAYWRKLKLTFYTMVPQPIEDVIQMAYKKNPRGEKEQAEFMAELRAKWGVSGERPYYCADCTHEDCLMWRKERFSFAHVRSRTDNTSRGLRTHSHLKLVK